METRREFVRKALYGILTLFGLGFLIPGLILFAPVGNRNKSIVYFPLVPDDAIPRSGVKKAELIYSAAGRERKARVFIVSSEKGLQVLSATCTHLGCLVNYNKEKGEFTCPCHGGRYDLSGKNISGPPPAPLNMLPFKIEHGMVMIGIRV
jgi:cytochrome b6-f complex iron-sulfur subunit